jgi:hypothetical protein
MLIFQIPPVANANCSDAIERVSICDLVQMPEGYEGKLVEVSATYLLGYENSEMYCLGYERGRTEIRKVFEIS